MKVSEPVAFWSLMGLIWGGIFLSQACGTDKETTTNEVRLSDCDDLRRDMLRCDKYPSHCTGFTVTVSKNDGACRWKF